MDTSSIIDRLSLRGFLQNVSSYLRKHCPDSKGITVKGLLELLLDGIQIPSSRKEKRTENSKETSKEKSKENELISPVAELRKAISGNPFSAAARDLGQTIARTTVHDELLKEHISSILDDIVQANQGSFPDNWYRELLKDASPIFFEKEKIKNLETLLDSKLYVDFFLLLLKHGFATLDNLPHLIAERLYEEALTYDHNNITRFMLFRTAADNGHKLAALEYGNYMNRTRENSVVPEADAATALTYTLMALPLSPAYWNLAYMLECHQLNASQVAQVASETGIDTLLEKLVESAQNDQRTSGAGKRDVPKSENVDEQITDEMIPDILRSIHPIAGGLAGESDLLAFKICLYLAFREERFYKAFNSLAKYCDNEYRNHSFEYVPTDGLPFRDGHDLAMHLYQIAIQGGCPPAMCNVGMIILKELKDRLQTGQPETDDPDKIRRMLELLETSAAAGFARSYETLGDYYGYIHDLGKACENYQSAINIGPTSSVLMKLAELEARDEERRQYYEQALALKEPNAAYYLAMMDYQKFQDSEEKNDKTYLLFRALSNINRYVKRMSEEVAKEATALKAEIVSLVNS